MCVRERVNNFWEDFFVSLCELNFSFVFGVGGSVRF